MTSSTQQASRQMSADESITKDECRTFGDPIEVKQKNSIRIMFQNVNGFGYTRKNVKSLVIRDLMNDTKVDAMAMAELNKNWGKMQRTNTLPQVCKGWFRQSRTVVSYNQHERKRKNVKIYQPGGTAVVLKGNLAVRAVKSHYDDLRLGRWSSIIIQGTQGIRTRIVSVYVPIVVTQHGHRKVAVQQQRALLSMGVKEHVLNKFWNDFWMQVDTWLDKGEQLIIGGDWNTNVVAPRFLEKFKKRNLVPAISTKHGNQLPAIHNNGSKSIDEIFISDTLTINAAGYLEHGSNLSDHCPIWVDISRTTALGVKPQQSPTYEARRLQTTLEWWKNILQH